MELFGGSGTLFMDRRYIEMTVNIVCCWHARFPALLGNLSKLQQ